LFACNPHFSYYVYSVQQLAYKIVQSVEGRMIATCPTDILAWAAVNDRSIDGFNRNRRQRPELQGQPLIHGLMGPMCDGVDANGLPVVRYEDVPSFNQLSA
jgi:hypothetical protein